MYQALYRKYRPKTFKEVVGQNVIIKTFENSIINNKITHAYLFTGPRGTGKTSIAKILAKIVNCESLEQITPCNKCVSCTQIIKNQNTDVIEIDAASNNGVDEIREIRDKVNLVPSFGKYKVYIIDEVHMLTTAAFNALLKTLEEPPKHIIFILATTEPHKIPATILSRCQRFDFKKISVLDIKKKLVDVCNLEKIEIEDSALELIAKLSDGGMRDSLSLLDQITSYTSTKITVSDVNDVYGSIPLAQIHDLITKILNKNIKETFEILNEYNENGKNLIKIMELMVDFLKNVLINYNCSEYFELEEEKNFYSNVCSLTNEQKIYNMIEILLSSIQSSKMTNNIKLVFELAIIKIIELDSVLKKINNEEQLPIYEQKKIIEKKSPQDLSETSKEMLNELKKVKEIRVNNALAKFNKKELMNFKQKFDEIKELLMIPEYSSIISLMLDGEIKVKGDEYIIFVYDSKNLDEYFNSVLIEIESVLKDIFKEKLKPIAISNDSWEIIKQEFNKNLKENKKSYIYIEESYDLNEIFNKNKKEQKINESVNNEIEEYFEDIIVYN